MSTALATRSKRAAAGTRCRTRRLEAQPQSLWVPPALGDLTFVDMFCGAGGSSLGLTYAGLRLLVGMNHWQRAIDTHSANFTYAEHLCEDASRYPLRRLPRADVLWASPICTEMSPAGGRPRTKRNNVYLPPRRAAGDGQGNLLDELGYVPTEGFERTRATHWNVVEATEIFRYKAVITENVADTAETWELFDIWLAAMCKLGYRVQVLSLNSAHIGDTTNPSAPQWRDRIYCVFTRLDVPAPDVTLHPRSRCGSCGDVDGVQTWSKATLKRVKQTGQVLVGRYRRDPGSSYGQYWYTCPTPTCHGARVEPYVRPAAGAIDWSDLGTTIGSRPLSGPGKRPVESTIARVKAGVRKFARPFVATAAGNTFERPGYLRAWPADTTPLGTQQCTGTDAVVFPPFMANINHDDERHLPIGEGPLPGRTTKIGDALVCPPFMTVLRTNCDAERLNGPMSTVTTGYHQYLTVPPDAMVVPYYSKGVARGSGEPFDAMTTHDRFALIQPGPDGWLSDVDLDDLVERCHFRMLKPRESLRAQRFPDTYLVTGGLGEQTMQAGNAVSANAAQFLGARVAAALCRTAANA